jgi:phosphate uptake regulator
MPAATHLTRTRTAHRAPPVVDLCVAREARRLREFQARTHAVDELNRKALARLYQTGLIFTRQGARLGRDLLLAHQHLLRVGDLLIRIGELAGPAAATDAEIFYAEAKELLARTAKLTSRTGLVFARGR